ncbi:retrovirus-related Pol polyprotein from type-1 retrotransposable element R2 [Caerostris darwini]|uniref:Retrovirus-related Pol polyprotein from type-1 retrotransposable element R2 n=1 Tax=Caerostris darwini TaxID=1538125 RepID=A0AAV4WZ64_9ARAC|nr:retrovirus-related Pol polyprotein from type-1 retrotransposable element R2 [Caerostris darwini]
MFENSIPTLAFHDLTLKVGNRRKILFSIRDRLRTSRTSNLLRKKNQGKALEVSSLAPASSHFLTDGAYTRVQTFSSLTLPVPLKIGSLPSHKHEPQKSPHIVPILVGALGSWDPENDSFLRRFMGRAFLNKHRKLCVSVCIRWSRDIYIEFLTGHCQYAEENGDIIQSSEFSDGDSHDDLLPEPSNVSTTSVHL